MRWFLNNVLSERQVAAFLVGACAVIVLQSWAWTGNTGDVISPDKGDVLHYLTLNGWRVRIASLDAFFPFFVGGQVLAVLVAVVYRSRLGLASATFLPLLWVWLVEVQS